MRRIHGIESSELRPWEIAALAGALDIIRTAEQEVFDKAKRTVGLKHEGWRKLIGARVYLSNLQKLTNGKQPRSFARDLAYPVKRDEEGNRLCRWCHRPVGKRQSYCSDECLIEVDCRTDAGQLRHHVKQRDHGICAVCKCDTEFIKRIVHYAGTSFTNSESYGKKLTPGRGVLDWRTRDVWKVFIEMGFNYGGHLWEADHIVEVVNGGESCLDNIQTLCMPCHKAKTRELHRSLARARRERVQPSFFPAS